MISKERIDYLVKETGLCRKTICTKIRNNYTDEEIIKISSGKRKNLKDRIKKLIEITGFSNTTIYNRIQSDWTDEEIINTDVSKPILITYGDNTLSPIQWADTKLCKSLDLNDNVIRTRYLNKWEVNKIFTTHKQDRSK